ncbi:MAG: hypothetical protein AB7H93_24470 [Vicinamibacterales bacterium]
MNSGRFRHGVVVALLLGAAGAPPLGAQAVLETFEAAATGWQVTVESDGTGAVARSTTRAASGSASARVSTASAGARAALRTSFTDAASAHVWQERPGTYRWQRARVYVPGATIAALGASGAATLARFWASGEPDSGWALRVRQGGALSAIGRHHDTGATIEFPIYATWPADQWVELEIGLHSQAGPGVKRAFAVVVNGQFHGWYHQGRMRNETYDRVAIGLVDVTAGAAIEAFVDDWGTAGTAAFPTGTDLRPTAALQEQDYRTRSGAQWQIDWSTWGNDLRLDAVHGLYSNASRLQSGRNIDRMPSLDSGWAEIEIGWPNGQPPLQPSGYFGPMVGFRKEINREQNLEIIPIGTGGGNVDLVLAAWNERELILARWPMPKASIGGQLSAIPQPGDVIRARWQQTGSSLRVGASFFDAGAATWHTDVIDTTVNLTSLHGVNFADGFHLASSITIDSPHYGIRRFRVGTDATFPGSQVCTYALSPPAVQLDASGGAGQIAVSAAPGCAWTAASTAGWLAVSGGAAGNGTATWSATANTATTDRAAAITIGGQSVSVTQAGGAGPGPGPAVQPPRDVAVAATGAGTVTLRWRPAASGPAPTAFLLSGGTAPGETLAVLSLDGAHRLVTLALPPGVYFVRLQAHANGATSAPSQELRVDLGATAPPSAPWGLTGVADGAALALSWRRTYGGGRPDAAILDVSGDASLSLPLGAAETFSFAPVPPGTYTFRVRSANAAGAGPSSNAVTLAFPSPCAGPPEAPRDLLVHRDGRALELLWSPPETGPAATGYVLAVSGAVAGALPTTTRSMRGAVGPGTYQFAVTATNPCGASPPAPTAVVTVP